MRRFTDSGGIGSAWKQTQADSQALQAPHINTEGGAKNVIFKDRADYVFGMNSIPVCTLTHCVIMLTDISNSNEGIYNLMRAVRHLLGDIEYVIGKGIKIR